MKPYFQRCHYCGTEQPINELEHTGRGFITCEDVLACNKRVAQTDQAYYDALLSEQKHIKERGIELIDLIEKQRIKMGLPDVVLEHHKAEVARIIAEG